MQASIALLSFQPSFDSLLNCRLLSELCANVEDVFMKIAEELDSEIEGSANNLESTDVED